MTRLLAWLALLAFGWVIVGWILWNVYGTAHALMINIGPGLTSRPTSIIIAPSHDKKALL